MSVFVLIQIYFCRFTLEYGITACTNAECQRTRSEKHSARMSKLLFESYSVQTAILSRRALYQKSVVAPY